MPVDTKHSDYLKMVVKWQRCTDVASGQDAIHNAGVMYLPELTNQSKVEYQRYIDRATFYNATWRTIVGLQGMLFRKPPTVIVPNDLTPMLENIDLSGTPLHIFALEACEECLKTGRLGIFIDFPEVDTTNTTLADALSANVRPFMKMYGAMSIINWKTQTIGNKTALSMLVLEENIAQPVDEFEDKAITQWRVLEVIGLADDNGVVKPVYRVRVFQKNEKDEDVVISTVFPKVNGEFLDYIPFQFISVDDTSWDIDEPPLIDLVNLNIAHYRVSADYEHGCHFTGLPTAVISGYSPEKEGETFYVGSMSAWVFPNSQASATYLEFKGEGLKSLENNLNKKETQMAILGARMLEVQNRSVESANTASIHRSGEQSMLSSVAQAISIGMELAMKMFAQFAGSATDEIKYSLNRDFFPAPMDSLMLTALVAAWQNHAYDYETLFANLQRGEVIALDTTPEIVKQNIENNPPPIINAPTTPGNQPNASPKGPKMQGSPATPEPTQTQLQK